MCRPQSSRHIPCAVHLESWQKFDCERLGGAYLHLFSDRVRAILAFSIHFGELKNLKKTVKQVADRVGDNQRSETPRPNAGFVGARHEWCYCVESQAIGKNSQGCDLWLAQPGWASDSIRLLRACRLVHGLQPWTAFDSQSDGSR
jgi:hypothetical protein